MAPNSSLELAEEILFASKVMVNILAEALVYEGIQNISAPQFRVLDTIYNGTDKPADVARMLEVSPSAISWLLDRLEQDGWLERTASSKDRRRVVLRLTETGRDMVRRVNTHRRALLRKVLENMEPETITQLQDSLEAFSQSYIALKKGR
ncbi:MAG: MarR family transcriptional regulator [Actinobacteria bacterium]|nr:MarR family transcriptional regulator [Actinomycetota bacterium]MBU1944721.1 MarR family transcriptional regulator [Actinomycetota bacterium]MBU2688021.1 MarR family transcriptional regulator [Actinomycetota bacterium]